MRQNVEKKKKQKTSEINLQKLQHSVPSLMEKNIPFYLKQFDELATKAKLENNGLKLIILKIKLMRWGR